MGQPKRKESQENTPEAEAEAPPEESFVPASPLSRKGWALTGAVVLLINLPLIHYTLLRPRPEAPLKLPYADDFSSFDTVAKNYFSTGGLWRVVEGQLLSPGVKNNPLWLKASLPQNVAVEFDVRSMSPEGDIKVEIFGDGSDHASGYVLIHGGWGNTVSIIARRDEHGPSLQRLHAEAQKIAAQKRLPDSDLVKTGLYGPETGMRVEAHPFPVELGRTYHWRIERRGGELRWLIDGQPFMSYDDPLPLVGKAHDRFAFSSWEAQLYFDNLKVEAL
jgi:hypothetical protein